MEDVMDTFLTSAGALALVKAIVDFVKYVLAKNTNGWVTQLVVWIAGIGVVLLLRASDITIELAGVLLADAKLGTVILAGLGLGSAAMLANEFKQAVDQNDSAAKPNLVPGSPPPG